MGKKPPPEFLSAIPVRAFCSSSMIRSAFHSRS